jgi:hypothetical protein
LSTATVRAYFLVSPSTFIIKMFEARSRLIEQPFRRCEYRFYLKRTVQG